MTVMNGWKFPLLALLFLAFCNTCGDASADGHNLKIAEFKEKGVNTDKLEKVLEKVEAVTKKEE